MGDFAVPEIVNGASRVATLVRNSRPWFTKAFFAIVDQGLISGSNFALGILLARWLGPSQYGAYALAFATFVLLSLVYQSLLLEPMSVFGPSTYRHKLRGYTGTLIWIHIAVATATFIVLGLGAEVLKYFPHFGGLPAALVGAAISTPSVLLFWLARRVFYLRLASSQAAVGAVCYSLLLFSTLALLNHFKLISAMMAFVVMAIAALMASAYLLFQFRPILTLRKSDPSLRHVARENWDYGRWALASALLSWVPWNIFYTLVASFSGMAASGQLRALLNFALPMAQTYAAFSLLFLPHAASMHEDEGWNAVRRDSHRITFLFLIGGVTYWVLICAFRTKVVGFLYAGQYKSVAHLLPWVGIASIFWGIAQGPAMALRAKKSPESVFVMYLLSSIIAVVMGIPATIHYGLAGAITTMLVASTTAYFAGLIIVYRHKEIPVEIEQAA